MALSVTLEACTVNINPYGILRGTIEIDWRGNILPVILQDEVRAARAEGSCYLLCILDLIREAERSQTFRSRRISHPELHETFQERWELILAMATDREASGLPSDKLSEAALACSTSLSSFRGISPSLRTTRRSNGRSYES